MSEWTRGEPPFKDGYDRFAVYDLETEACFIASRMGAKSVYYVPGEILSAEVSEGWDPAWVWVWLPEIPDEWRPVEP